jgi:hypothetical protein
MLHRDRVVRDDSGNQDLAGGQPATLPDTPLVFMPRIRRLDPISSGAHLQNEVNNIFQLSVRYMRHVPASETHVIAHPILGNSSPSMIQSIDSQLRPLAMAFRTLLNQAVAHIGKHCVIHLDEQTGFINLQVLLTQCLGEGEDVPFLSWIVFIHAVVSRTPEPPL